MKWQFSQLSRRGKAAIGGAVLVFLFAWPTQIKVSTDFVLEPGTRAFVRAQTAGWVESVEVQEGQEVAAEQVVAILRNPEVEARVEILRRQREAEEQALAATQAQGDMARSREHSQRREQLRVELAQAQVRRDRLVLRAPVAGNVITPRLGDRLGQFLAEGGTFCEIADRQTMRARMLVPDRDVEEIQLGATVKLNLRARPLRSLRGRVEAVSSAAAPDVPPGERAVLERRGVSLYNYFAVQFELPNPNGELWEGMTGTAKIYGRPFRPAVRVARSLWRWVRSLVW